MKIHGHRHAALRLCILLDRTVSAWDSSLIGHREERHADTVLGRHTVCTDQKDTLAIHEKPLKSSVHFVFAVLMAV